jgi:hypothetical protein
MLKAQADSLTRSLDAVRRRIETLKKGDDKSAE